MNITYPTSAALKKVEPSKISLLTQDDPTFELFPIVEEDTDELHWEQMDAYTGLQNARGLDGEPGRVVNVGAKSYKAEVGYYGDFDVINETEFTKRRKLGTFGDTIDLTDLMGMKQDNLLAREVDRLRYMIWTLLATGTYSAFNKSGALVHGDSYTFQTASAAVPWATVATATPLADFRAVKLKSRGFSTYFDQRATAYMNQSYANFLLANANSNIAELGMKRLEVGQTVNSIDDLNKLLVAQDCPRIKVYDEGWSTEGTPNSHNLFIPDNKVVVIGPRKNGAPVGDVCRTRNANNENGKAGSHIVITDSLSGHMNPVPRKIRIDRGWNGGMRIYYPSSICILTV